MLLYGKYLLPHLLQLSVRKQTLQWLTHQHTRQRLTVLLQRHSVLTGVSTAWLQMVQPNSPNKVCTENTSVLPAGKGSGASGLHVSSPLLAAQQWGNTKGYRFSLALSLATSGSHFAGELIWFVSCGYLRNYPWALAKAEARRQEGFEWVKEYCVRRREPEYVDRISKEGISSPTSEEVGSSTATMLPACQDPYLNKTQNRTLIYTPKKLGFFRNWHFTAFSWQRGSFEDSLPVT